MQVAGDRHPLVPQAGLRLLPVPGLGQLGDPAGVRLGGAAGAQAVAEGDRCTHQQDVPGQLVADDEGEILSLGEPEDHRHHDHQHGGDDRGGDPAVLGGGEQGGGDRHGQPDGRVAGGVVGEQAEHADGQHQHRVAPPDQHQRAQTHRPQVRELVRSVPATLVRGDDDRHGAGHARAEERVGDPGTYPPLRRLAGHEISVRRGRGHRSRRKATPGIAHRRTVTAIRGRWHGHRSFLALPA